MIRPQQKQRKEHQEMMNELHPGDEVVTIGRMHGTLDCEGIYLTFDMVAIARVIKRADAPASEVPQDNKAVASSAADSSADASADSAASEPTSAASASDEQKGSEEK